MSVVDREHEWEYVAGWYQAACKWCKVRYEDNRVKSRNCLLPGEITARKEWLKDAGVASEVFGRLR